MYKLLQPTKDAYITNRVINGTAQVSANVGSAGSLDLFKLYGNTSTLSGSTQVPNVELSRLLLQFDLSPLRNLVSAGKVDTSNPSFSCRLYLSDVYGGQPTPSNFTVVVNPLSGTFDEGLGRDVVLYSDGDVCNWLTASSNGTWFVSGCGLPGDDATPCDFLTASNGTLLTTSQLFAVGDEDLNVDVTLAVSATLAGLIPDAGFRVAFQGALEGDQHTYFVKRFASRTAYNDDLHPKLIVRFDDSVQDDTTDGFLDAQACIFLRNYVRNVASNLVSGSTTVTGMNSLILQLITPVSGGTYSLYFTGSQHYSGINPQSGLYSASIFISSNDPVLAPQWHASGSITFTPIWQSIDGTVSYLTGSPIVIDAPQRGSTALTPSYDVTISGIRDEVSPVEQVYVRINIFDRSSPMVTKASRLPIAIPGKVVRDVHYQVRDAVTRGVIVPFDAVTNSTRASSDSLGMYFKLDASNLTPSRSYVIDVLIIAGDDQYYESASTTFRVADTA